MQDDFWQNLLMTGIGAYVIKLWVDDYRAARANRPVDKPLPGATPASARLLAIGALGGFAIVTAETWGESALGISGEQSHMTAVFAVYTLVAAFVEEVIFRGFIVLPNKGTRVLWMSIVAASALFAAIHPFLWAWEGPTFPWQGGHLVWKFGVKGWFSTGVVFVSSLWFYALRFGPWNQTRSLLPSVSAHVAKNVGVIAIKACQGFLVI